MQVRKINAGRYAIYLGAESQDFVQSAELTSLPGGLGPDPDPFPFLIELLYYLRELSFYPFIDFIRGAFHIEGGVEHDSLSRKCGGDTSGLEDSLATGGNFLLLPGIEVYEIGGVCGKPYAPLSG